MPFTRDKFVTEFKEGDLVYGLAKSRDEFLESHFKFDLVERIRTVSGFDFRCFPDDFYNGKDENERKDRELYTDFWNAPLSPKYGAAFTKWRKISDEKRAWKKVTEEIDHNTMSRYLSKVGLHWTAQKSRTIHFVLYGLNMEAVVKKAEKNDWTVGEEKHRSITGAELRWIYRNQKDARVSACVQFWRKNMSGQYEPCCPPWVDDGWDKDSWERNFSDYYKSPSQLWEQYFFAWAGKRFLLHIASYGVHADNETTTSSSSSQGMP